MGHVPYMVVCTTKAMDTRFVYSYNSCVPIWHLVVCLYAIRHAQLGKILWLTRNHYKTKHPLA